MRGRGRCLGGAEGGVQEVRGRGRCCAPRRPAVSLMGRCTVSRCLKALSCGGLIHRGTGGEERTHITEVHPFFVRLCDCVIV